MRIVFMGTPDFAAASLQKLLDEDFDVVGVFTQPDKPKNRGMKLAASPVKEIALGRHVSRSLMTRRTSLGSTYPHRLKSRSDVSIPYSFEISSIVYL